MSIKLILSSKLAKHILKTKIPPAYFRTLRAHVMAYCVITECAIGLNDVTKRCKDINFTLRVVETYK